MTDISQMAEARPPVTESSGGIGRITPWLFAVAIFTSAALVFSVQPIVTRLVLPTLGGSPSVWNTAMVFFQAALLAGYGYAHLLQRIRSLRAQVSVHLCVLLVAALFLPLGINAALGDPDPSAPIFWLLGTLAISVGAPFAALSATAPLLQAWFARVMAGTARGANPYVLYAASNLGSFLALLAYPTVVEPLMSLAGQRNLWSGGYALFLMLSGLLAALTWGGRGRPEIPATRREGPSSPAMPWRLKGLLVLLAAIPTSLMLGVTAHLSTDVASAPFLWVAPLALYLLTFVVAFQDRPVIPVWVTLLIQAALGASCASMVAFRTGDWMMMVGLHLATFFFTALMCHQLMALRRPAPDRLTEFYLLLSLGGVLGGVFNALIAPAIFNYVWEYPLVLVLAGLARPWRLERMTPREIWLMVAGVLVAFSPPILFEVMRYEPGFRALFNNQNLFQIAQLTLGGAAVIAFLLRERAPLYVAILAAIVMSAHHIGRGYDWSHTERSFFGVMRIANVPDPRLGGDLHVMMHGTTIHGAQPRSPEFSCTPSMYYAPATPLGQATRYVLERGPANIGVIGLGSGAMAAWKRPQDRMTFFEIDPMVDRLARDPQWFTYISDCAGGDVRTVLGDARLTLEREPAGSYDLLLVDAFSSDSIPTHLLTIEAIEGYLRAVKPNGVVVLHLSNRHLDITRPAVAAARALGASELHQVYGEDPDAPDMAEASTEALILSPTSEGLDDFFEDMRWVNLEDTDVRPWRDDYVNLFGAMARHMRDR
jgi:predicted O-methyltransferase YrrM